MGEVGTDVHLTVSHLKPLSETPSDPILRSGEVPTIPSPFLLWDNLNAR